AMESQSAIKKAVDTVADTKKVNSYVEVEPTVQRIVDGTIPRCFFFDPTEVPILEQAVADGHVTVGGVLFLAAGVLAKVFKVHGKVCSGNLTMAAVRDTLSEIAKAVEVVKSRRNYSKWSNTEINEKVWDEIKKEVAAKQPQKVKVATGDSPMDALMRRVSSSSGSGGVLPKATKSKKRKTEAEKSKVEVLIPKREEGEEEEAGGAGSEMEVEPEEEVKPASKGKEKAIFGAAGGTAVRTARRAAVSEEDSRRKDIGGMTEDGTMFVLGTDDRFHATDTSVFLVRKEVTDFYKSYYAAAGSSSREVAEAVAPLTEAFYSVLDKIQGRVEIAAAGNVAVLEALRIDLQRATQANLSKEDIARIRKGLH
ncbi:hypothetical protein HDU76_011666, partial [Blyttiomyces sp. JEL0837]